MDTTIKLILQELIRRIWIIILCGVIGLCCAFVYTKTSVSPVYSSSMKISTLSKFSDEEAVTVGTFINMMNLAQRRADVYIELMNTNSFYQRIAEVSGTGYTASAVKSMLSFSQVENMGMFYITITGIDPNAIKAIGDALAQEMLPYIEQYLSQTTVDVIEPPYLPTYPMGVNLQSNCVKGFLLGALLVCAVIAVLAFFDTRIKSEDSLTQRYDIPILGSIPDFSAVTDKKRKN